MAERLQNVCVPCEATWPVKPGSFLAEMEKRVDTGDISVLIFFSCANFLAAYHKQTINTVLFWTVLKAIS